MKIILAFFITSLLLVSQYTDGYAQVYYQEVDDSNLGPKPEDGCHKKERRLIPIVRKPITTDGKTFTTSSAKIYTHKLIYQWTEFVCPDDVTQQLYKVIYGVLTEKGFAPTDNYEYNHQINSHEQDTKQKAISALHQYQADLMIPVGSISYEALDSLNIDINQLDQLEKDLNMQEPSLKELLKYNVKFDLERFDEDGLIGPADGKRSVDYSYFIPNKPQYIEEVKAIDPSYQERHAPQELKRLACDDDCIFIKGTTHQENFLEILYNLSQLEYMSQIHEIIYK